MVTIKLPLLKERTGDVSLLVHHFIRKFALAASKDRVEMSPDALRLLCEHAWPGNVRELRNVVERAVVLCEGNQIRPGDLPDHIREQADFFNSRPAAAGYKRAREQWVDVQGREYLSSLLERHNGNVSAAAREAQISRKSFYELMKRFEIDSRRV